MVGGKVESNEQQQTAYAKTKELLRTYPNLKGIQGSPVRMWLAPPSQLRKPGLKAR
ncbi:hypothetical protein [Gemmobacter sp. 24YEA27]|uniref:hypothetical protein n=1 Tax=Gemmobacter sp. 24YEA27 TaxID=3040672 RepID=UPI0024B395F7|nr:hypothetical protein [Gemmobacter sp. 24YEA27]